MNLKLSFGEITEESIWGNSLFKVKDILSSELLKMEFVTNS